MSKPTNPVAIGGFVLGAAALGITGLFVFGGHDLWSDDKMKYVTFFESSLNGLEVGAPVKMQGVKIGTVADIALQMDPSTGKVYKPVVLEIERSGLAGMDGQMQSNRDRLVHAGFRARLEMQSLLTGLLYVDFDVHSNKAPVFTGLNYEGLLEIPSVPPTTDEIRNTVDEVVRQIRALPLKEIVTDFSETLRSVRDLVGSEELRRSGTALAASLEHLQDTTAQLDRSLKPLLENTNRTLEQTSAMMRESGSLVRDFRGEVKPLLAATGQAMHGATTALEQARSTLEQAHATLGTVQDTLGPESGLQDTLLSLRDAARSLRDLADSLERHPESVVSGKAP